MSKAINLTGKKFDRLAAIKPTSRRDGTYIVWLCLCDCGNECLVRSSHLQSGAIKSCGCLAKDIKTKHGMYGTVIYKIWNGIIQRCRNPNHASYKNYGGRGIKVCARWLKFENFYADVGDRPKGMTFDRWPNNNGDYEPSNWRWATYKEQVNNRRPNSSGRVKQRWFRAWHKDSMAQCLSNNQHKFAHDWDLDNRNISACLRGERKRHKGWTFQHLEFGT